MSPRSRRRLLHVLGAALSGGLAGCVGGQQPGRTPEAGGARPEATEGAETGTEADAGTRSPSTGGTASPTPRLSSEPVRCRGDPITAERSLTDEPGYDDGIEYFPSNETVRFVSHRRGGEPALFDTWTFEEWGAIEAANVGRRRVHVVAGERLGTSDFQSSTGRPPDSSSVDSPVIRLRLVTRLDRDGEVVGSPSVALPDLADHAPRSADVTLTLDGDEFAREVPVFAEATSIRLE